MHSRASQIAVRVENRIARARPFLRIDRLTTLTPARSESSCISARPNVTTLDVYSGSQRFATTEGRRVVAAVPEGILLVHSGPRGQTGADRFVEIVRALELIDPVTGERTVVTKVSSPIAAVIPRGANP